MIRRWTAQEEQPGYQPPREAGAWPRQRSLRGDIAGLRSDVKRCGGSVDSPQCQKVAFRLGVALLGGSLFGHEEDGERLEAEIAEGADIMRRLAESGSAEGVPPSSNHISDWMSAAVLQSDWGPSPLQRLTAGG